DYTFLLCHRLAFADTDIASRRYMDAVWVAPGRGDLRFERGILLLGVRERVVDHEHDFGPFRGEGEATAGLPGLDQHRMPLRRARHAKRSARPKVPPHMVEPMHLGRVGEAVIRLVQDQ